MTTFGEKVKKLRKEKGWSQDEFADKIDIHGRHIGKYENGKVLPNAETLVKISRVFEVSIDYLLLDSNDNANPAAKIQDRELLHNFELIDQMTEEDRNVVKSLIDAYVKKRQMESVLNSGAVAQ